MDEIPDYLKRIIFDLLHYRRATIKETEWFKAQRHNVDLCPLLEAQVEKVLTLFDRYHRTVHDIQGLRDRGVDVLLKYGRGTGEEVDRYNAIGFQVKSFPEIGIKGWLKDLKAQCLDASTRGLVDYYVLFCTHAATHKDEVRDAVADLIPVPGVTPVGPEFAYTFLHLAEHDLAAYIKSKLSQDDAVFRAAVDSLAEFSPTEAAILIELLTQHLFDGATEVGISQLRGAAFVAETYWNCPDIDRNFYFGGRRPFKREILNRGVDERFREDFSFLEGGELEVSSWGEAIRVPFDEYRAIEAIMLDASVRYGYQGEELRAYTLAALQQENLTVAAEVRAGRLKASHRAKT